jgi:hypothetical protein
MQIGWKDHEQLLTKLPDPDPSTPHICLQTPDRSHKNYPINPFLRPKGDNKRTNKKESSKVIFWVYKNNYICFARMVIGLQNIFCHNMSCPEHKKRYPLFQ